MQRVEDGSALVPGIQIFDGFAGRSGGGGKILREARRTVEGNNGDLVRHAANDGVNHRSEIVVVLQLAAAEAAGFDGDDQGHGLASVIGVQGELLLNAVVGDAEIRGDEIEDQRAVPGADERRDENDGGFGAESRSGSLRPGRSNREEEKKGNGLQQALLL